MYIRNVEKMHAIVYGLKCLCNFHKPVGLIKVTLEIRQPFTTLVSRNNTMSGSLSQKGVSGVDGPLRVQDTPG